MNPFGTPIPVFHRDVRQETPTRLDDADGGTWLSAGKQDEHASRRSTSRSTVDGVSQHEEMGKSHVQARFGSPT